MHNKLAPVGEHTLADYDAYVEAVHEQHNGPDARATGSAGTAHDQHGAALYAPAARRARAPGAAAGSLRRARARRRAAPGRRRGGAGSRSTRALYTGPKGRPRGAQPACSSDAAAPSVCTATRTTTTSHEQTGARARRRRARQPRHGRPDGGYDARSRWRVLKRGARARRLLPPGPRAGAVDARARAVHRGAVGALVAVLAEAGHPRGPTPDQYQMARRASRRRRTIPSTHAATRRARSSRSPRRSRSCRRRTPHRAPANVQSGANSTTRGDRGG